MILVRYIACFALLFLTFRESLPAAVPVAHAPATLANRLTYLDDADPFYVGLNFPKLTTPQWIGETNVEAVVVLAIDDMRDTPKYETFLRPILDRLEQVEGTAALSIMCNALDPQNPQLQSWLREGVSLEVHTLTHPCPLLAKSNFVAAADTYLDGIGLINQIPSNHPFAFRMPCCDSINSPSPRFYAELFNQANSAGQFLTIDSSVMNITTPKDAALPRDLTIDADGREKFRKYLPFASFVTTVEDYPYPYVIGKLGWEFPCVVPSDWEAQHIHGTNNPVTVADWKAAIDATVIKQGSFNLIFHPHGWIRNDQIVELINYATSKYGKKIKFLNFRDAQARLNQFLLGGQPIRAANGQDNGVRLIDVNHDGYLDVVIANDNVRKTRLWNQTERKWTETEFPAPLITVEASGKRVDAGVKFGVIQSNGNATAFGRNESGAGAWDFDGQRWIENRSLLIGLSLDGKPVLTREGGRDRGVRFRDVDADGRCELIVGNDRQSAVFSWSPEEKVWKKLSYALPSGTAIVDAEGRDNGLRFVDINEDGYDDVAFSNERSYSLNLFVPKLYLGFQAGWSREVVTGTRGQAGEIPMIVRAGPQRNNGVWFHSRHLWAQNEETAHLPDLVDRRSFDQLLGGLQPTAKSPQDSLACIRVRPGFKVELVAFEPLVKDPIAFEWGADGKLWVVEMGDYPLGLDGHGKSGGIVRFLEDTDGDGQYDKSTVFLDGVNFPTGVMPWRKGVLVSAAPEIFYAEDTDGDGKADVRKTLFTGFKEGNQQHRVNGFEYGLDGWIYGANGDSGGEVRSFANAKVVKLSGHDFRFRPDTGEFEAVEGQTQYGRHRDDWGNWFGNNNPSWGWHYFIPERYLARNPHLPVKTTKHYLANYENGTRVFAISRLLQRFNDIGMVNHVTSANSIAPYRDELFGAEFTHSVFVSEPVHNVVHREVLEPDGVTFSSHRAVDEKDSEFLASTDNWFRPVTLKTGPDGALYIADMYRLVLEHPEWIPPDTQKSFDLRAGSDLGRIYRVYPEGAILRKIPRLDQLDTAGLVAALDSPNGWQRDTAQRLLVERRDRHSVEPLKQLAVNASRPKTRLQAIFTLQNTDELPFDSLLAALRDSDPRVQTGALIAAEPIFDRIALSTSGEPEKLNEVVSNLVESADIKLAFRLALSLGESHYPSAAPMLARLAIRHSANEAMQLAILSSAPPHLPALLSALTTEPAKSPPLAFFIGQLIALAVDSNHLPALQTALAKLGEIRGDAPEFWQLVGVAAFVESLERQNHSLNEFAGGAELEVRNGVRSLNQVFVHARRIVADHGVAAIERTTSTRLLGRGLTEQEHDISVLGFLLEPQVSDVLRQAALESLSRLSDAHVGVVLLSRWKRFGPTQKTAVADILLSRPVWVKALLYALESDQISPGQISTVHRQRLLKHSQESIRDRAAKLFASANADRQKLIHDYESVANLKGDAVKGVALYRQNCLTCHRFKGEGFEVGPDLGTVADKPLAVLLTAILDPNQAIEARYLSYSASTKNGREVSGIVVAETPGSVTLRSAGGSDETILRNDLKEFSGSGLSLMPEGLENVLKPQDMADLIAYLRN
ncbi:MAG: VCBS repeat-containing protein [Verrucomicrobia bacterium]|nr:VCBS repeat-containing protein [Verrucomicrobiota bacterium]